MADDRIAIQTLGLTGRLFFELYESVRKVFVFSALPLLPQAYCSPAAVSQRRLLIRKSKVRRLK